MKKLAWTLAAATAALFAASTAEAARTPTRLWYRYDVSFRGSWTIPPPAPGAVNEYGYTKWKFSSDGPVLFKRDRRGDVRFDSGPSSEGRVTDFEVLGDWPAAYGKDQAFCPRHMSTSRPRGGVPITFPASLDSPSTAEDGLIMTFGRTEPGDAVETTFEGYTCRDDEGTPYDVATRVDHEQCCAPHGGAAFGMYGTIGPARYPNQVVVVPRLFRFRWPSNAFGGRLTKTVERGVVGYRNERWNYRWIVTFTPCPQRGRVSTGC